LRIAVVGGGISGLATAYYIKKNNSEAEIDLYEKESNLGGKLKTTNIHGYTIENGGIGFLQQKESFFELIHELGLINDIIYPRDERKAKFIFDGSKILKIPENPSEFLSSPILSLLSKIRAVCEFMVIARKSDIEESVQKFGYRRIGKEFTDKILDMLASSLYASTAQKLSINAAFPAVVELEKKHSSLIFGMLKKNKKNEVANCQTSMLSLKGGMQTLITAIVEKYEFNILKNEEVVEIANKSLLWSIFTKNGKKELYDKVVLCTPSYITARILKCKNIAINTKLKQIDYSPIAVVSLGYDESFAERFDGAGILTTKDSNTQALYILFDSFLYPYKSENGNTLLRVVIGGQRQPMLASKEENELIEIAISAVHQIMKIDSKPVFTYISRWHKALPNYTIGHIKLVESIRDLLKTENGLYINSSALNGIGISDCISSSFMNSAKVIEQ
jgi:oxygen-dependent protoporphyrinogen oxidase